MSIWQLAEGDELDHEWPEVDLRLDGSWLLMNNGQSVDGTPKQAQDPNHNNNNDNDDGVKQRRPNRIKRPARKH